MLTKRSASSRMKNLTFETSMNPFSTRSTILLGVPVMISQPSASHFLCFLSSTPPPVNKAHSISGFIKYFLKEIKTSCVCSAKSLTGSRIIASGFLLANDPSPLLVLLLLFCDASTNDLMFCSSHSAHDTKPFLFKRSGNFNGVLPKFISTSASFTHIAGKYTSCLSLEFFLSLNATALCFGNSVPLSAYEISMVSKFNMHVTTSPFPNFVP
mmetsp:Transcript_1911/g.6104  ORF Transcript_1911/g.6104 Transcript_1911/m.6104 type:complete len:212 (-) Transcript_1911:777-1412(-)